MPCLERLFEQGTAASIEMTGQPAAVAWAGMVTGVTPRGHGIYDDYEVRPDGGGIQPVGAQAWRAAPLWRLLVDQGVASVAISCPATAPASAWPGVTVLDERFASAPPFDTLDWPLAPGAVEPPALRERYRNIRLDPADLDADQCGEMAARPLAYAATIHAVAVDQALRPDWQFLAVAYPALGPSQDAAAFLDMSIDRLVDAAGPDADLVVVSMQGAFVAAGPGFPADKLAYGVRNVDVAATIMARFGLRIAESTGRPISGTRHNDLRPISGALPVPAGGETMAPAPGSEAERVIFEIRGRSRRLAALEAALLDGPAAALPLVREALVDRPGDVALQLALGQCGFLLEDAETCRTAGEAMSRLLPDRAWGDLLIGAALALEGSDAADAHIETAAARGGDEADVLLNLGALALRRQRNVEAARHYAAAARLDLDRTQRAQALAGQGMALLEQNYALAERHLRSALGLMYDAPMIHHQLGLLLARQHRWMEAVAAFGAATKLAPSAASYRDALRAAEIELAVSATRPAALSRPQE